MICKTCNSRKKLMHLDQEDGLKPHIGLFLALNGHFRVSKIFFGTCTTLRYYISRPANHDTLDIVIPNHNAQSPKLMFEQENGPSWPIVGAFIELRHFSLFVVGYHPAKNLSTKIYIIWRQYYLR